MVRLATVCMLFLAGMYVVTGTAQAASGLTLRGLAFSGQASDCLFHAAIRNFSYSAWTSRGG
ncbi:hypothetical protein, partial [Streptomyces mirabilis]|uniref:hypothetical protein n=1 Tax=Streptomyces mirabilis TaxID=68239 RepID=UPI00367ED4A0